MGDINNAGASVSLLENIGFRSSNLNAPLRNFAYASDGTICPIIQREYQHTNIADVSVIPNPFNQSFEFIVEASHKGEAEISIFNSVGQNLFFSKEKIQKGTNRFDIDQLSHFPEGIYFIQVKSDGGHITEKLIKQG